MRARGSNLSLKHAQVLQWALTTNFYSVNETLGIVIVVLITRMSFDLQWFGGHSEVVSIYLPMHIRLAMQVMRSHIPLCEVQGLKQFQQAEGSP